jgi:DNA-binding transcriptional LysR family regulator
MSDRIAALRLFVRVARLGGFSAAGREAGLPQSTVSRRIGELERAIGARLLTRTTRAVSLTDAGAEYMTRIEAVLEALDEADEVAHGTRELRGWLRVAAGTSLGGREIVPLLPDFMRLHPNLSIDLVLDDRRQDLITEGIDVALRLGTLPDSTATARLIRSWPRILVASPAYLANVGHPHLPGDLERHALVLAPTGAGAPLTFRRGAEIQSIRVGGRLRVRASEGAIAAGVAGLGIVFASPAACRRELESGALVRILGDWDLGSVALHAIFPAGRATKRSARAFVDCLSSSFREMTWS